MSIENLYSLEEVARKLQTTKLTILELASNDKLVISYKAARLKEIDSKSGDSRYSYDINDLTPDQAAILLGHGELNLAEYVNVNKTDDGTYKLTQYEGDRVLLKSGNGYIVFPTWLGGLIFQWGSNTFTSAPFTINAVTLPIVFPNALLANIAGGQANGDNGQSTTGSTNISSSQIGIWSASSSGSVSARWIAIGY